MKKIAFSILLTLLAVCMELQAQDMVSSQLISVDEFKQDIEITYNKDQQKIVLTVDFPIGVPGQSFYLLATIDPMPIFLNYNPYYYYYHAYVINDHFGNIFFSLDDAVGPYFVALANDIWMRKKIPFYNNGFVSNTCYYSSYISPNPLPNLEPINDGYNLIPQISRKDAIRQEVRIRDIETNIECIIEEEQTEVQLNE